MKKRKIMLMVVMVIIAVLLGLSSIVLGFSKDTGAIIATISLCTFWLNAKRRGVL